MAHKHYNMCRGRGLGFNPSAQSHDPLLGRLISCYDKSEDKAGAGRTGWDDRQAAVAISPPPAVTGTTVTLPSAALQFVPVPEHLLELISFSPDFTLVSPHFLSPLLWIPA